tara:strand:+ start:213 stop:488 length:276 start_codon:yes stop_codon:yes gene_type:complete
LAPHFFLSKKEEREREREFVVLFFFYFLCEKNAKNDKKVVEKMMEKMVEKMDLFAKTKKEHHFCFVFFFSSRLFVCLSLLCPPRFFNIATE